MCEQGKRRVKTGGKKEIESHHGVQESPVLRKGERERKNYGERERGKLKSKQQRHRMQERGRDREYNVIPAAHISTQCHAVATRLS